MFQPMKFPDFQKHEIFSPKLLADHVTLYEGYVTNVNNLDKKLDELRKAETSGTPEYAELSRRYSWEFNGMRLHELYFRNIASPTPIDKAGKFETILGSAFGSFEEWKDDFAELARLRGNGWVILYHDFTSDQWKNGWVDQHNTGLLVGAEPLLVLDVWEHAYLTDYGLKRDPYIEAFFNSINWISVAGRVRE